MYYFVERSVAVLKPKQPFLEWVNQTFSELSQPLTLDSIRIDCNAYLIPESSELEDGINFIDEKYADLFALELSSWTEEEDLWPKDLSLKAFWEWFDVEISSTAVDITEDHPDIEDHAEIDTNAENTIH